MNRTTSSKPRRALRSLDLVLKVLLVALVAVTALAVPLTGLALAGRGTISVSGQLETPFSVGLADGRRMVIGEDVISYENFAIGEEHGTFVGVPSVGATVRVRSGDTDSRAIVIALVLVWLAAGWVGLLGFRGIVRSAVDGEPFAEENPRRLRRLGLAMSVVGGSGVAARWLLDRTLDVGLPFRVSVGLSTWFLWLVAALATLALAEPFAEATRLRELDASTI